MRKPRPATVHPPTARGPCSAPGVVGARATSQNPESFADRGHGVGLHPAPSFGGMWLKTRARRARLGVVGIADPRRPARVADVQERPGADPPASDAHSPPRWAALRDRYSEARALGQVARICGPCTPTGLVERFARSTGCPTIPVRRRTACSLRSAPDPFGPASIRSVCADRSLPAGAPTVSMISSQVATYHPLYPFLELAGQVGLVAVARGTRFQEPPAGRPCPSSPASTGARRSSVVRRFCRPNRRCR